MPEELKLYEPLLNSALLFHQSSEANSSGNFTYGGRNRYNPIKINLDNNFKLFIECPLLSGNYKKVHFTFLTPNPQSRYFSHFYIWFKISNTKKYVNEVFYEFLNNAKNEDFIFNKGVFKFQKFVYGRTNTEDLENQITSLLKFCVASPEKYNLFLESIQDLPLLVI